MSCTNSMRISKKDKVDNLRKTAKQGDFFFANYLTGDGPRKSPVFIVGNDNDKEDVIICKCTTSPPRTDFDKKVLLKEETYVRTNKVYTIPRASLLFKIPQSASPEEFKEIKDLIKKVFDIS